MKRQISNFTEENLIKVLPQFIFEDNLVPYDVTEEKSSVEMTLSRAVCLPHQLIPSFSFLHSLIIHLSNIYCMMMRRNFSKAFMVVTQILCMIQFNYANKCNDNPDFRIASSTQEDTSRNNLRGIVLRDRPCSWIADDLLNRFHKYCSIKIVADSCGKTCGTCTDKKNMLNDEINSRALKSIFSGDNTSDEGMSYEHY